MTKRGDYLTILRKGNLIKSLAWKRFGRQGRVDVFDLENCAYLWNVSIYTPGNMKHALLGGNYNYWGRAIALGMLDNCCMHR